MSVRDDAEILSGLYDLKERVRFLEEAFNKQSEQIKELTKKLEFESLCIDRYMVSQLKSLRDKDE